mgnify:CR=1 FL=1
MKILKMKRNKLFVILVILMISFLSIICKKPRFTHSVIYA